MIRVSLIIGDNRILFPFITSTKLICQVMKECAINTLLYMFLLALSIFLSSCSHNRQAEDLPMKKKQPKEIPEVVTQEREPAEQIAEAVVREKELPPMIQIQNFSLTDKTLTFSYRLSNPFKDDIWVCYDVSVYGKQDVQHSYTIIDGETVWIKLRCNFDHFTGFENPPSVAKYIRLQTGVSCTGRIVRNLPIKNYIGLEPRKEKKEITLHRVVFEFGYFEPKWNKFFNSIAERFKKKGIKPKPRILGSYYYIDGTIVTEETLDGQSHEVMYLNDDFTPWIKNEVYAEVVITDIAIPCSVVDDDKLEH